MGEYAKRLSDGAEIKIGTCEDMYYLRFEDRDKVAHIPGNVDPNINREAGALRFRLPFPDEDEKQPGEYGDYNRGLRLYRQVGTGQGEYCEDFTDESTADKPGNMQLHHPSGLLINVPCYHGIKLPDVTLPMRAFWNGKTHSFVLSSLRGVYEHGQLYLMPVVSCQHCGEAWRYSWSAIWDYVPRDMQIRLRAHCAIGLELERQEEAIRTRKVGA